MFVKKILPSSFKEGNQEAGASAQPGPGRPAAARVPRGSTLGRRAAGPRLPAPGGAGRRGANGRAGTTETTRRFAAGPCGRAACSSGQHQLPVLFPCLPLPSPPLSALLSHPWLPSRAAGPPRAGRERGDQLTHTRTPQPSLRWQAVGPGLREDARAGRPGRDEGQEGGSQRRLGSARCWGSPWEGRNAISTGKPAPRHAAPHKTLPGTTDGGRNLTLLFMTSPLLTSAPQSSERAPLWPGEHWEKPDKAPAVRL